VLNIDIPDIPRAMAISHCFRLMFVYKTFLQHYLSLQSWYFCCFLRLICCILMLKCRRNWQRRQDRRHQRRWHQYHHQFQTCKDQEKWNLWSRSTYSQVSNELCCSQNIATYITNGQRIMTKGRIAVQSPLAAANGFDRP